jgi:hypothetical protein
MHSQPQLNGDCSLLDQPVMWREKLQSEAWITYMIKQAMLTPSFCTRDAQKNWSLQVRVIRQHDYGALRVCKPRRDSPEPRTDQSGDTS